MKLLVFCRPIVTKFIWRHVAQYNIVCKIIWLVQHTKCAEQSTGYVHQSTIFFKVFWIHVQNEKWTKADGAQSSEGICTANVADSWWWCYWTRCKSQRRLCIRWTKVLLHGNGDLTWISKRKTIGTRIDLLSSWVDGSADSSPEGKTK